MYEASYLFGRRGEAAEFTGLNLVGLFFDGEMFGLLYSDGLNFLTWGYGLEFEGGGSKWDCLFYPSGLYLNLVGENGLWGVLTFC